MSVFTKVSVAELTVWLKNYVVGSLIELQGIAEGIENTNYFVTTSHGRFVLTLFERLSEAELHFYLDLMAHLARHGIPCPSPIANQNNEFLGQLNGKPATLVTCLPGKPVTAPAPGHCAKIGAAMAEMHMAGQSFKGTLENPRGPAWWRIAAPKVMPFLDSRRRDLLDSELAFQSKQGNHALPRGPVHADLFRDNALWVENGGTIRLGGVIDFYFAGIDSLLFDVAVTVNDWCADAGGEIHAERAAALLGAYRDARQFTCEELAAWPAMLRAAALRFWLSRLYDFYLPRPGELTHAHDPEHFRRVLQSRRTNPGNLNLDASRR
ncbi:MAG: homoserine kinase [Betaproteobacteria bacterium RIFCSPLOWO2_02_FULL_62_17]|nr:MAG: homoserine kinase [Betaproteobacteria bacterium RIFCSPLOWO2_02_FULL_62_17]